MSSYLSWLDYSERERRKMLDVIHLFEETDTVDELGLGTIRDAIADHFFPGTGTVQTRARYFFFIPWMYLRLEGKRVPSAKIADRARSEELNLVERFLQLGMSDGVIGRLARRKLKRLPSNIYWLGLETLGFRCYSATQANYHGYLDHYYRQLSFAKDRSKEDDEPLVSPNWNPCIPEPPDDVWEQPSFVLTKAEADFFRDQLKLLVPSSLLAWLVWNGDWKDGIDFIWEHPQFDNFPKQHKADITHARLFSLGMHGAALMYNLLLAEKGKMEFQATGGKWEADAGRYREALVAWRTEVQGLRQLFIEWRLVDFWDFIRRTNARYTPRTRAFIDEWLGMILDGMPGDLADNTEYRALVEHRERQLKRGNARLANRAALENWSGASGVRQLGFRWTDARTILHDIYDGMGREQ